MSVRKALFVNFSDEAFTGFWNGEAYKFGPAGSSNDRMHMEEWKARHFAKHLTNRELLKIGKETHTSPKNPEQDVIFMEVFNQALVIIDDEAVSEEQASSELIDLNTGSKSKGKRKTKDAPKTEEEEEEFPELTE